MTNKEEELGSVGKEIDLMLATYGLDVVSATLTRYRLEDCRFGLVGDPGDGRSNQLGGCEIQTTSVLFRLVLCP